MFEGNVEVVRRVFDAVNAGDFDAVPEFFADDVVLVLHGEVVNLAGEGAVGKDGFVRWFADWFRTFERGYRFELGNLRTEGDRVMVDVDHHARGRASGAEVTMPSAWVFELSNGKIARCDGYAR